MAALVAQAYPEAKRSLIAHGLPPARVEAMPAIQVVFLDIYKPTRSIATTSSSGGAFPFPRRPTG